MNLSHLTETQLIRLATYASVIVAALLICLKFYAWWVTHSVSIQAALIDSLLDGFASFINMIAVHLALKPPDAKHRFGHGKIEAVAALGQSIFIGASAVWLLSETYERFMSPQPSEFTGVGVIAIGVALLLTLILITYQQYVVRKTQSAAIAADMLHYKSDFFINLAALVSLLSAKFFHIKLLDPLFGLFIGLYILWTAVQITMEALNILMDSELDEKDRDKVLSIIKSYPEVVDVRDLKTRSSGVKQFFQLNLVMHPDLTLRKADQVADNVEEEINKAYPKSQVMIRLVPEIPGSLKHKSPSY